MLLALAAVLVNTQGTFKASQCATDLQSHMTSGEDTVAVQGRYVCKGMQDAYAVVSCACAGQSCVAWHQISYLVATVRWVATLSCHIPLP
jgi:hypothetical protein